MAKKRPFRISGGAAGIAQTDRVVLGGGMPFEFFICFRHQVFVAERIGQLGLGAGWCVKQNIMFGLKSCDSVNALPEELQEVDTFFLWQGYEQ